MVLAKIAGEATMLAERMEKGFRDESLELGTKDATLNRRIDELKGNTEATFKVQWEHIEEMVRTERSRLGTLQKDLIESSAKLRSDFRAEMDRLRVDCEQDNSKITEDLTELHSKHDVSKQEINFFQQRLLEQKDWTQRTFTET